jgi:peptide deformylase
MKILRRTQFGNPILRQKTHRLSGEEISSEEVQTLIKDMKYTLENKEYGIGLAAPQKGKKPGNKFYWLKTNSNSTKFKEARHGGYKSRNYKNLWQKITNVGGLYKLW